MKKIVCLAVFTILMSVSLVSAKIIFVGSHGGVEAYANVFSGGSYADPLEEFSVTQETKEDYIRNVVSNEDEGGNGVDASIAFVRIKCNHEIRARIYDDGGNVSDAFNWIKSIYKEGDHVFLVGYSAGGKFVLNLASLLDFHYGPVHYMGLIDPIVWINNIQIQSNVEVVDVFIQQTNDFWGTANFLQGCWFFLYDGDKTEYHNYTVTGSDVDHLSIDNKEIVWRNMGRHMLYLLGIDPDAVQEEPDLENDAGEANEIPAEGIAEDINDLTEAELEEVEWEDDPDIPGSGDIGDTNLTIDWVRMGYRGEPDDNCTHELQRVMRWGESVEIKVCTQVGNKGDFDADNSDLDYRIEDNRDFDDDDLKLHDEEIDIDEGYTVQDCMRSVFVKVSEDGTSVKVSRDDKHRTFPVIDSFAKFYMFVDVEGGGDQDISSETDHEEYGKMEITVIRSRATSGTYFWLPAILNYIME